MLRTGAVQMAPEGKVNWLDESSGVRHALRRLL